MLHKDSFIVSAETFQLIQQLQTLPQLKNFHLVGGTALALQIGHRNSVDIDLFTQDDFETEEIFSVLKNSFAVDILFRKEKNTLLTEVNKIKTDFIKHDYPLVKSPLTEDGISFLSYEDIAAMKLNAISNSGQRLKDFIDIYFLLEKFSLNEMLDFYAVKYPNTNTLVALKAVSYFDDIDLESDKPKMKNEISIDEIQKRILQAVSKRDKKF